MAHPFEPEGATTPSELTFTFQHAQRANFVDEGESKLADTHQGGAPALPAKPTPSTATLPSPAIVGGLECLDLSAPAPQTKVIPPPRNYILTRHAFKTSGDVCADTGVEETPPGLCGFSATLIQPRPSDAASMLLIGGASDQALEGSVWKLHVPTQKWSRLSTAGGPGAIFGHSAVLMGEKVWVFGGLSYKATFNFAQPEAAAGATMPAGSPQARSAPSIDLEQEDEDARKRLVAAKLQAKLAGLTVADPKVVGSAHAAPAAASSSSSSSSSSVAFPVSTPGSADSSPKLTDAAGSPGGGVGHEAEDADESIDRIGLDDDSAEAKEKAKGGLAWRMMAGTGKGLWKAAKMPWKATKATTKMTVKSVKAVGKVLYPSKVMNLVYGPPPPKTKAEQYGVAGEAPEIGPVDANGDLQNTAVRLASQQRMDYSNTTPTASGGGAGGGSGSIGAGATPRPSPSSATGSYASASTVALGSSPAVPLARGVGGPRSRFALFDDTFYRRGEAPVNSVHVFDPANEQWMLEVETRGVAPEARYFHAAAGGFTTPTTTTTDAATAASAPGDDLAHECFYLFGGAKHRAFLEASNDLWRGAWINGALVWTEMAPMVGGAGKPPVRGERPSTIGGGKAYSSASSSSSGRFGPGKLPSPRHGHSFTNIGFGYALLFGGAIEDAYGVSKRYADTWIYDTQKNTWYQVTTYGSPASARAFHTATLHSARFLHIFAGETNGDTSDLAILDLHTMAWSRPLYDSSFSLEMHGLIALDPGKCLVFGGLDPQEGLRAETFLTNTLEVVGQCDTYTSLQCKIVVCGSSAVGKTSLIRRFVEDRFTAESKPLGQAYRTVLTLLEGKLVKIHVWDIPADASLKDAAALMRECDAAVLVYDPAQEHSLENLATWANQVEAVGVGAASADGMQPIEFATGPKYARDAMQPSDDDRYVDRPKADSFQPMGAPTTADGGVSRETSKLHISVVAHKSDLPSARRVIPSSSGRALAHQLGPDVKFWEKVSSKEGLDVDKVFLHLAKLIVQDRLEGRKQATGCAIC